ncbi:MAG TPA: DUF2231 domain-containing protein [Allosphingosinicella sp.]|nr:DUF2231 domain-containing protein [Allosphingosinicella sp.]
MNGSNPRSTAQFMGHPIHPALVSYPIAFFTAAFLTDLAFLILHEVYWATFSFWLLVAGLVTAALAALAGLTDFLGDRRIRDLSDAWMHMVGNVTAVVIELVNLILRLHDHAGPIASPGVYLSGIAFLILGFTGWKGGELVFRHRVGVIDGGDGSV